MTVIAGAVSRSALPLPGGMRESLIAAVSRSPQDRIESFGTERWLLAKLDVNAFRASASFQAEPGHAFMLAGEPMLSGPLYAQCGDRGAEARRIFDDLVTGRRDVLQAATGAFCAARFDAVTGRLQLIADKLGVRPLYYLVTPGFVAFASALRILEAVGLSASGIDLRGVYETAAFGFPLSDRTSFDGIRAIGPAEVVSIDKDNVHVERYFDWGHLQPVDEPPEALVARLVDKFDDAVMRRARADKAVLSFLSGGLDSRAIVAALRQRGITVYTLNFAPPGAQDRVFAAMSSERLGTRHHQLEVAASSAVNANRQEHLQSWVEQASHGEPAPERPGCLWSGDGGSVGLGHVYLDAEAVRMFEAKDLPGAIDAFLRYNKLPGASNGVLTRAFRARTSDWHVRGITEEIAALDRPLDGRSLYLFLLFNDQRRHLAKHFENIDLHRFEFHLPFFDSDFLAAVTRAPVAPFLGHRLYLDWLKAFSPESLEIPWQAYPNHIPCPVPFPKGLRYQWRRNYFGFAEESRLARNQGIDGLRLLLRGGFPGDLVNRFAYTIAVALSLAGSNAYAHLTRVGSTFVRAAHLARGPAQPREPEARR